MSVVISTLLAWLGVMSGTAGPAAPPATLTVYAAASLTEAFTALGKQLEADHPGLTVRFNFAGSPQLAAQIEQGAPADLFASADRRWMELLSEKGLVDGEARVFARNRLVVIIPRTNPARIRSLQDLTRRGIKLVLAAEAVPVGKYSRQVIANLATAPGYPPEYDTRVLGNVVSQEENVKSVVAKVQLGESDAGFVYHSDVTPAASRHVRVLEIPDERNVIARYPMTILKDARNAEAARWFFDLVLSAEGQKVLQRHGLMPLETASRAPATP